MKERDELIKRWIEKADHDLGTAIIIQKHLPDYYDTIAFHCQQAVEKYLKTYLVYLDITFKKIHNLNYLINLIDQYAAMDEIYYQKATKLQKFAVEIRYPEIIIELSSEDITEAISISKEFRKLIIEKLGIKGLLEVPDVG